MAKRIFACGARKILKRGGHVLEALDIYREEAVTGFFVGTDVDPHAAIYLNEGNMLTQ